MKILVTGASGFIGSYICTEALERGMQVWAGMRTHSSKQYLQDTRMQFAYLDLEEPEKLRTQLSELKNILGGKGWDYIIHAAGATKSLNKEGFFRTNTEGTRNLIDTLRKLDMVPRRFVFVSSLSIYGAIREQPVRKPTADNPWIYAPILDSDAPKPNTAYGQSKLEAERYLMSLKNFPFTILRPTGVYGPRERDYFLMAKSIQQHIDFAVGYKPQEITFVYVMDVVQAVFKALEAEKALGKGYFLSDGNIYNSRYFSDLLQAELGIPWVLHIKAPLWFLRIICTISEIYNRLIGKLSTLNRDKYHILTQRNWQCDITPAKKDLGYDPKYPLEKGVRETVAWYKQVGWLK